MMAAMNLWKNPKFFAATHVSFGKIPLWCDSSKNFWPCLSLVCCLVIWFCLGDDSCSVGFCFMARYDSRIMLNLFLQSCFPTVEMEQCRMRFQTVRACCSIISLKWGWRGFPDWWKNRLFLASNKLYLDTRCESAKSNLSKKVAQGGCVPDIP